jgi:two-component sensor histidine kinase
LKCSRQLKLAWNEVGGPDIASPARQGFGLKLIEREVGFNLGGTSAIDFQKDGLKVTMVFPLA